MSTAGPRSSLRGGGLLGGHVGGGADRPAGARQLGQVAPPAGEAEVGDHQPEAVEGTRRSARRRRRAGRRSGLSRMLLGFRSRWMTPWSWAYWTARARVATARAASRGARGRPTTRRDRGPPGTNSRTRNGPAVVLAELVDRDDVRVVERRQHGPLAPEAVEDGGRSLVGGQDHLEGDPAVEPGVDGLEDLAHAADPGPTLDPIGADPVEASAGRPIVSASGPIGEALPIGERRVASLRSSAARMRATTSRSAGSSAIGSSAAARRVAELGVEFGPASEAGLAGAAAGEVALERRRPRATTTRARGGAAGRPRPGSSTAG